MPKAESERQIGDTAPATPASSSGSQLGPEAPAGPEAAAGTVIHLGSNRRAGQEPDAGGLAPYSKTAFGLSALGRAQERARRTAGPSSTVGPVFGRPRGVRRGRFGRRRGIHRAHRAQRARRRGRLIRTLLLLVVAAAVVAVGAAVFAGVQLRRPVPRPILRSSAPATVTVAAPLPALPWPPSAESAVAVLGYGSVGRAGSALPVPIASLAKVMTAMVLLRDHPLTVGESGPEVPISAADQATYQADYAAGDSVAPVLAGETLSELQLLEGLLIPSADNLAPVVAAWDAGTQAAFVARMNELAAAFAMRATHYADPSGVSASTVSTAADQLRLAEEAAANPVLMSIVRQPQLVFPNDPELLDNYNSVLGQQGIVGIKTGATTAAGGCFMLAADADVDGHFVQVVGVVLGERGGPLIASALHAGETLINPALAGLHAVTALPAGTVVAHITDAWGRTVAVSTEKPVRILHLGSTLVGLSVAPSAKPIEVGLPAGSQVATVRVDAGGLVQTVAAVTDQPIIGPSRRWRVEHG